MSTIASALRRTLAVATLTALVLPAAPAGAAEGADLLEEQTVEPQRGRDRRPFAYSEERLHGYLADRRALVRGEAAASTGEDKPRWNRALPFFAQRAVDLGFKLPKPYGVSVSYATVDQDLNLEDLQVRASDGTREDIDFIAFDDPDSDSEALQVRFDAWLLPFMNVYAVLGRSDGDGTVPFEVPGSELLNLLLPPAGALCDTPERPEICDETVSIELDVDYEGTSYGIGTALAGGWSSYFTTLNLSYVITDLENAEKDATAWSTSARIGYLGERGNVDYALFVGVDYLKSETDVIGSASLDLTDVGPIDRVLTADFELMQSNAEATSYFVGLNLDISRSWHFTGQYGFGGSREQVVVSLTRRF